MVSSREGPFLCEVCLGVEQEDDSACSWTELLSAFPVYLVRTISLLSSLMFWVKISPLTGRRWASLLLSAFPVYLVRTISLLSSLMFWVKISALTGRRWAFSATPLPPNPIKENRTSYRPLRVIRRLISLNKLAN